MYKNIENTKKKKIAGREYLILPVNIKDMCYIMGDSEDIEKLVILDKKQLEAEDNEINRSYFRKAQTQI